jgi:O-6-methylguanine DNA methyltransferase
MHIACIQTSAGFFTATFSQQGLARLEFPVSHPKAPSDAENASLPTRVLKWAQMTAVALDKILTGLTPKKLPPLDLTAGTEFQQRVWAVLAAIPRGECRTYGQIAAAIGKPDAVRAVGQACGANPIPVFIPCHRVVAADGQLGGFSGGLRWKRQLLAREGNPAASISPEE